MKSKKQNYAVEIKGPFLMVFGKGGTISLGDDSLLDMGTDSMMIDEYGNISLHATAKGQSAGKTYREFFKPIIEKFENNLGVGNATKIKK